MFNLCFIRGSIFNSSSPWCCESGKAMPVRGRIRLESQAIVCRVNEQRFSSKTVCISAVLLMLGQHLLAYREICGAIVNVRAFASLLIQSLSFVRKNLSRRPGGQCGFPILQQRSQRGNDRLFRFL